MAQLSRRSFIRILGGGTAALGIGMNFAGSTWAQAGGAQKAADSKWSDWEFYYPGKYDEEDAKIIKEFMAACEKVEKKGDVNISDLVSGKLTGNVGIGRASKITASDLEGIAKANVGDNPLFMDRAYAKKDKIRRPVCIPHDFIAGSYAGHG